MRRKKEIPKYSRMVDIKEIEENDFNLNIRRYVDNSPDSEIEDVRAHLFGGVPKKEVSIYAEQFAKFNLNYDILLTERSADYLEFKENISDKNQIKELIENSEEVKNTITKHKEKVFDWWQSIEPEIEQFFGRNNLWKFRNEALEKFKESLLPLGTFDEFKIAGIFANWWEDLVYDFKSIISAGWNKNLVERERIKEKYFKADLEELENLESSLNEFEGDLSEILEEVEDWDEEEQGDKTANKVKEFLKDIIKDLSSQNSEISRKEAMKWNNLLERINQKEKEIKKLRKAISDKEKEVEKKTDEKIETLTEKEVKGLLLEKFLEVIQDQLEKYLTEERKEIIKIFENLWNKYKVPLNELEFERDMEVKKLSEFLKRLGYNYE